MASDGDTAPDTAPDIITITNTAVSNPAVNSNSEAQSVATGLAELNDLEEQSVAESEGLTGSATSKSPIHEIPVLNQSQTTTDNLAIPPTLGGPSPSIPVEVISTLLETSTLNHGEGTKKRAMDYPR